MNPPANPIEMWHCRIAHDVLSELFADDAEPIPTWADGDEEKIATLCGCTEVTCLGHEKYPDLPSKCSKLFYAAIKIHPFPNGNKRFGLVLTVVFLRVNDHMLTASNERMKDVATEIAETNPLRPDGRADDVIDRYTPFFRDNISYAPFDIEAD